MGDRIGRESAVQPGEGIVRQALVSKANASGGWGYYAGKSSRIEPTCWAVLALDDPGPAHASFLSKCQSAQGWLIEDPNWPVNIGFNGLAAFTWLARPDVAVDDAASKLLTALIRSKGIRAEASPFQRQDNSLQGWPWIDSTFSWIEPTCWGLLALKRARRAGKGGAAIDARIDEAERLLFDRVCSAGGWNFGNANVMQHDLRAYVPATALGLLALQDRRDEAAVVRSLQFLEAHWMDEISASSLGLSLIALKMFHRDASAASAAERLSAHAEAAAAFGNAHGLAVALAALSRRPEQTFAI
jgi:hypothetical protein